MLLVILAFFPAGQVRVRTYCNPVNINYRFQPTSGISYREAADPVIRIYRNKYLLLASHSGGYWTSDDLMNWDFIPISSLPIEDYAPDIITISDTTYYAASSWIKKPMYWTTDPFKDNWRPMEKTLPFPVWDPAFLKDDDGKIYLYWGCSDQESQPIRVVQLDRKMQPLSAPDTLIRHNPGLYGWENPGEMNQVVKNGYNEGAWMTKFNKRYYLQYASPGTEFKTYADGVYTSDSPRGPFRYETYSPFSYKPGGFIGGAGHSSTFCDKYGNWWHIATMSISVRHMFERRLGLFPSYFDKDGVLRTLTAFGDYPARVADHKIDFQKEDPFTGWMLLSYKKKVSASSSLDKFPPEYAADENVRTWWSAATGNQGEWFSMDLGDKCTVNAVQVNFADNDAVLNDKSTGLFYCYRVLSSEDGKTWKIIIDKSTNNRDACHDYTELDEPARARFIKVENGKVPGGKFSMYDLRIFGSRQGSLPTEVRSFKVIRKKEDSRRATVIWKHDPAATGHIVNFGTDSQKLYSSVMVYDSDSLRLTGLNRDAEYYYSVDSFNECGIKKGTQKVKN